MLLLYNCLANKQVKKKNFLKLHLQRSKVKKKSQSSRELRFFLHSYQCCGTVTIFYGSGSNFWKVMVPVPVPTFETVMVPVPVSTYKKLRFRFRFQLHIYIIKCKFFIKNLLPFYIVSCFTRKKIININKFIAKCERKKC